MTATARELIVRAPAPAEPVYDAIVIGSGMSGLCSAVILAKEGCRVLVLERHYRTGGYLHRFHRKGGVAFDVGFHYLGGATRDHALGAYLDYCGVLDRVPWLPLDPDGYDELRFPGVRFVVPADREAYCERLCRAFDAEREGIRRHVDNMRQICDGFGFYRLRAEQDLKHVQHWMGVPLGTYLDTVTHDPRLRAVLLGQNPLYGVEPRRAPVGLHALVTDSFMTAPAAIRGGGDALARVMVERVRELGGTVRTRRRVTDILVDPDRHVCGVRTDRGEHFRASRVVSCAHPKATVRLLPEGVLRRGYRQRLMSMEEAPGTFSVFYTTRADLSHYAGRNLYHYASCDVDSLYAPDGGPERFVFVTVPTAREGVGRGGLHQVIALSLMHWPRVSRWQETRTGRRGAAYEAMKQRHVEEVSRQVFELVPELRGAVVAVESASPLTNRDYAASENGAAYGIRHCVQQSGRYGVRPATRIRGLYLTGQSVLMPGVCGVTISAFYTCAAILGVDYLMTKVRQHA